eukprot:1062587-Pyramimonas_sp.AAC.1
MAGSPRDHTDTASPRPVSLHSPGPPQAEAGVVRPTSASPAYCSLSTCSVSQPCRAARRGAGSPARIAGLVAGCILTVVFASASIAGATSSRPQDGPPNEVVAR